MDYLKKTVILKGAAEGTFTMQRGVATKYSLSWRGGPMKGDIFVFDDKGYHRLTSPSGILPTDISSVYAIGVGDDLSVRGQLRPFNWAKARAMISPARKMPPKEDIVRPLHEDTSPAEEAAPIISMPQPPMPEQPKEPARPMPEPPREPARPMPQPPPHDESCPMCSSKDEQNPFPKEYPRSRWKRHEYPSARGKWHYLTGELFDNGGKLIATALALPGSSAARPGGSGFNNYRIAGDGRGYWIRINRV